MKTETLPKESLESSSDRSVLDPDDNLFDVFSDKETLTTVLTSFFANERDQKQKKKDFFQKRLHAYWIFQIFLPTLVSVSIQNNI